MRKLVAIRKLFLSLSLVCFCCVCCSPRLPQYGCGRGWTVVDANRLIHLMLKEDILEEYGVASQNSQFPTDMMYLKLGDARDVSSASAQDMLQKRSAAGPQFLLVCCLFSL